MRFDPNHPDRVCRKLHSKIVNIRKDFLHQVSRDISKNHAIVVVEDLDVKSMSKSARKQVAQKSGLNRSILDASPFALRSQLQYKTTWQGGLARRGATREYQPQVSEVQAHHSDVRVPEVRFLGQRGLGCGLEHQRGRTCLVSWRSSSSALSSSCQEPTEANQVERCA
jgi:IS605 OrfB family transposase